MHISEVKQLKMKITHLNELLASLGRETKPEVQSEVQILTSTPNQPPDLHQEIEEYLSMTDESWGEII